MPVASGKAGVVEAEGEVTRLGRWRGKSMAEPASAAADAAGVKGVRLPRRGGGGVAAARVLRGGGRGRGGGRRRRSKGRGGEHHHLCRRGRRPYPTPTSTTPLTFPNGQRAPPHHEHHLGRRRGGGGERGSGTRVRQRDLLLLLTAAQGIRLLLLLLLPSSTRLGCPIIFSTPLTPTITTTHDGRRTFGGGRLLLPALILTFTPTWYELEERRRRARTRRRGRGWVERRKVDHGVKKAFAGRDHPRILLTPLLLFHLPFGTLVWGKITKRCQRRQGRRGGGTSFAMRRRRRCTTTTTSTSTRECSGGGIGGHGVQMMVIRWRMMRMRRRMQWGRWGRRWKRIGDGP